MGMGKGYCGEGWEFETLVNGKKDFVKESIQSWLIL